MTIGSKILDYAKLHLFGLELSFIELKAYQEKIETTFELEAKKQSENYNSFRKEDHSKNDPQYVEYIADQIIEQLITTRETYPLYFRASFLIQIISLIESELRNICENHIINNEAETKFKDLKGKNDIDAARKFIQKNSNLKFDEIHEEWNFITMAIDLRNVLAHKQGEINTIPNANREIDKRNIRVLNCVIEKDYLELKLIGISHHRQKKGLKKGDEVLGTVQIVNKEANLELLKHTESFFKKLIASNFFE